MFTLAAGINNVDYNESYWNLGIIAIAALLLMVIVFSILPLRTKLYEIFLCLHILLGIVVLIGLWYHVVYRYHKAYGYEICKCYLPINFTILLLPDGSRALQSGAQLLLSS